VITYYAWATTAAGIYQQGPMKGQGYPRRTLLTAGGRVLICRLLAVADALKPEGTEVVALARLPLHWTDALEWHENVKKILIGSGTLVIQ